MSNEKSELHITDIERDDKARWVLQARQNNVNLKTWVISVLNAAAPIPKKRCVMNCSSINRSKEDVMRDCDDCEIW